MGSFNVLVPNTKTLLGVTTASTATTSTTGVSAPFSMDLSSCYTFVLDVTAASGATSTGLSVGIQCQLSNGSWYTLWQFSAVTTDTLPISKILGVNPVRAISEAGTEYTEGITARATSSPTVVVATTTAKSSNVVFAGQVGGTATSRIVWSCAPTTSYTFSVQVIEAPRNILAA